MTSALQSEIKWCQVGRWMNTGGAVYRARRGGILACLARAAPGSVYCAPHRAEAMQRVAMVSPRTKVRRWS